MKNRSTALLRSGFYTTGVNSSEFGWGWGGVLKTPHICEGNGAYFECICILSVFMFIFECIFVRVMPSAGDLVFTLYLSSAVTEDEIYKLRCTVPLIC